jgi:hypothetical protein
MKHIALERDFLCNGKEVILGWLLCQTKLQPLSQRRKLCLTNKSTMTRSSSEFSGSWRNFSLKRQRLMKFSLLMTTIRQKAKATATCSNDGNAYGYPPAYGVPANVAVQLLYDSFKVT